LKPPKKGNAGAELLRPADEIIPNEAEVAGSLSMSHFGKAGIILQSKVPAALDIWCSSGVNLCHVEATENKRL
jgi:hypothetical protein